MEGNHISASEQRGTELTLGCHLVLPQGVVVSKGLMEKGVMAIRAGMAGTQGGDTSLWSSLSSSRFHPSLEGRLRGLSGMGTGRTIPTAALKEQR